jgi:hypothetical protein
VCSICDTHPASVGTVEGADVVVAVVIDTVEVEEVLIADEVLDVDVVVVIHGIGEEIPSIGLVH